MLRKLKNILLYAGVERNSFERIRPKIQKMNLTMTTTLSTFATVLITAMLISSFSSEGIMQNRIVYLLGLIMSVVILICSLTFAKRHPSVVRILVSLSYSIYYLYGILIGTITDPSRKTVTFMVMLVFMPILFIDRPMHVISITSGYVLFFIILCYLTKTGTILSVDVIDAIVFGILGCASGIVINQVKVRGYIFEQQLHEISRIDQLTQLRNRNAFEFEKDSMSSLCKTSLGCVYIDVNGLHEINNEQGHDAGDKMLKYVASEVKDTFSDKLSFRVGGDEFIAFVPDASIEDIEKNVQELVERIEKHNYHVAIGCKVSRIRLLSLDYLISEAEKKMIINKKLYYKNLATRDARMNNLD